MKKTIVIITITAIILIAVIAKHNDIYNAYKMNQTKIDIINISNGKFNERTYPYNIEFYNRQHKSLAELNHNNITELINVYINSILNGMDIYIKNNEEVVVNKSWEHKEINKAKDVEYGKDIWMKYYVIDYGVGASFTDFDVKNYKDGTFRDALIEKLKNCLEYEEKDNKIEWYIDSTEDKKIELPYNCYIDYKAYHREDNKEFKKVIDVKFNDDIDFDKETLYSYGYPIIVEYETINNKIKEVEVELRRIKKDDKEYYNSIHLYEGILTFGADTKAECTLSNHTVDRWEEEADIEFFKKYPIVN